MVKFDITSFVVDSMCNSTKLTGPYHFLPVCKRPFSLSFSLFTLGYSIYIVYGNIGIKLQIKGEKKEVNGFGKSLAFIMRFQATRKSRIRRMFEIKFTIRVSFFTVGRNASLVFTASLLASHAVVFRGLVLPPPLKTTAWEATSLLAYQ